MEQWIKQLRKAPRHYQDRIGRTLPQIFSRNLAGLNWKKLKGYEDLFRVRIGDYRIIYHDNGKEIMIMAISPKSDTTYNDL